MCIPWPDYVVYFRMSRTPFLLGIAMLIGEFLRSYQSAAITDDILKALRQSGPEKETGKIGTHFRLQVSKKHMIVSRTLLTI